MTHSLSSGRPRSLSEREGDDPNIKFALLRINLPDNTNTMVKLPENFTLDTVLVYVCQKRSMDSDVYTLTCTDPKLVVELDRQLTYYVDEMKVKEMNLVPGDKVFTTMIEKENDTDVMIYQLVQTK